MEIPHEKSRNDERALLAPLTRLDTGHCHIVYRLPGSEVGGIIEFTTRTCKCDVSGNLDMVMSEFKKKFFFDHIIYSHHQEGQND